MQINVRTVDEVTVVDLEGEIDANTAAVAQETILPLAGDARKLLLEMTRVTYMSSAGLRLLLATYRRVSGSGGHIVLVGLSDELRDTMSMTGFLDFFATQRTIEDALTALATA
jgi:anti-sigma B factor antagonist